MNDHAHPTTTDTALAQFGAAVYACLIFSESWDSKLTALIGDVAHRHMGVNGPGPSVEDADDAREIAQRFGINTDDLGDDRPSLTFTGRLDPECIPSIEAARVALHDITRAEVHDRAEVSDLLDAMRNYIERIEAYAGIRTK